MRAAALVTCVLLSGCKSTEAPCAAIRGLQLTRLTDHAGAGRELTVRLEPVDGIPRGDDLSACLTASFAGRDPAAPPPAALRIAPRPIERAYTLLLVDPGANRAESDAVRAVTGALARLATRDHAIAIYRWGAEVTQVAPFLTDPERLLDRLTIGPAPSLAPAADAVQTASRVLGSMAGPSRDALRTLVLVAPRAPALEELAAALPNAKPHLLGWVGSGDPAALGAALPPGLRFVVSPQSGGAALDQAAVALGERLDAYRRSAHYGLGACGAAEERSVVLGAGAGESTAVDLPFMLEENRAGSCDPEALAGGRRHFPGRLELVFTPEQRAAAEVAYRDRAAQPNFDLSVRVAERAALTAASAHFRGGGSYACQRRNYSVNLQGKVPRFFFPGFASSKFHLVAMCLDRLYLRNFTALQMMAEEGLMPIPFDLVELVVDGVSQGPYLVVENVSDSLRVHSSGVTAVLRRNSVPGGQGTMAEVRWSALDDAAALGSYAGILGAAEGMAGPALERALSSRFDLAAYLGWVALMNLIGSGDYVDEVYFYAVETTSPDGRRADYHRIMGWDQDDLFAGCHYSGRFAVHDPNRLIECAEAELDRRIFVDPHLYRRYADVLATLLAALPARTVRRFPRPHRHPAAGLLQQAGGAGGSGRAAPAEHGGTGQRGGGPHPARERPRAPAGAVRTESGRAAAPAPAISGQPRLRALNHLGPVGNPCYLTAGRSRGGHAGREPE